MTTAAAVDVVIATRNRPELLRRAIAGVVAQTVNCDITCHVVFDQCEPDESLASDYPGRRVRVLTNSHTPGLAGGRNTGILAGSASMVAFCDDDDVWLPEKLEVQLAQMEAEQSDTSVTGIVVEYEDRSVVRVPTPDQLKLEHLVRHRVMAAHPSSVVVRRSALSRIGLVDEQIPGSYGEDFDWLLRAVQAGPISVVVPAAGPGALGRLAVLPAVADDRGRDRLLAQRSTRCSTGTPGRWAGSMDAGRSRSPRWGNGPMLVERPCVRSRSLHASRGPTSRPRSPSDWSARSACCTSPTGAGTASDQRPRRQTTSAWPVGGSASTGRRLPPPSVRRRLAARRSASRVASSSAISSSLRDGQRRHLVLELHDPAYPLDADAGRGQGRDLAEPLEVVVGVAPPAATGAARGDQPHPLVGAQRLRVQPGQLGSDADDVDGRLGTGRLERRPPGGHQLAPSKRLARSALPVVAAR